MVKDLILKNRSYRRFDESRRISRETLVEFVDYARRTASASNRQPLRYYISNEQEKNDQINSCLGWAGYLTDWDGPKEGERPSAYIVLLSENGTNSAYDEGIVGQSILLMAVEQGLGGCILLNVKREELKKLLHIPNSYDIRMVIALGVPAETVVLEEISTDGDIRYYRDENQVHHVPKLQLSDILIN
jgi:nitroreductase